MKDKNVAAILAIFLGWAGIHRFYLGQVGLGIFYCILMFTGISFLLMFIDFISFLVMDRDIFDRKYNKEFLDADFRRYDTDFDRRRTDRRRRTSREERREARREREERRRDARREREARRDRDQYRREKRETEARKPSRSARPARPKAPNPYKLSGIQKYKDFDYEEAIEDFLKALTVDAKDVAVHFNLSCAYSLTEQHERAFFHLDKAVEYGFNDFERINTHDALAFLRIQDEFDTFVDNGYRLKVASKPAAPSQQNKIDTNNNLLEQLKQLGELREKGLLTEEEFQMQKKKLLG